MSAISGLIKVTKKGAKAPAKAPPFYSAVDNAVDMLPNKATPEQMIKELLKQKEVKAQELIDRGIDKKLGVPIVQKERTVKLKKPDAKGNTEKIEKYFEVTPGEKGAKAITKDEVINTVEQNPPKQIFEETPGGISKEKIDDRIYELIEKETREELGPRPRLGYEREDWLEDFDRLIEEKSLRRDDYYQEAKEALMEEGNIGDAVYDRPDLKLPGGENYREILLKLPTFDPNKEKQLMELEANLRRMNPADFPPGYLDSMQQQAAKLRAEKAAAGDEFKTPHWDQPNVLAHMRVQDRVGPNGEKVLHVEEIQSDWHQAGRKKGYRKPDQPERLKGEPYQLDDGTYGVRWEDGSVSDLGWGKDHAERLAAQGKLTEGVPDAPFKKNWHELAMKRLINYASENGYDKIAITPGAEQAKRFDISKQISKVQYDPNERTLFAYDKNGREVISERGVDPHELDEYIGKEPAEKLRREVDNATSTLNEYEIARDPDSGRYGIYLYGEPSYEYGGEQLLFGSKSEAREHLQSMVDEGISREPPTISGLDLVVGGEGMKGFYDQMLPAYLNKYGEKYGAKVGQLPISSGEKMIPDNAGLGMIRSGEPELTQLHSFDITPSMREEVLTKGQPLYQQIGIPAATGAAGAEMLGAEMPEEPGFAQGGAVNENTVPDMSDGGQILQGAPFKRGGKVSITNNPDAMFLELNDKKFRRK